jgi:hypothetical protein
MQKHKRNAKTQKKCKNTKEMQKHKRNAKTQKKCKKENETKSRPFIIFLFI